METSSLQTSWYLKMTRSSMLRKWQILDIPLGLAVPTTWYSCPELYIGPLQNGITVQFMARAPSEWTSTLLVCSACGFYATMVGRPHTAISTKIWNRKKRRQPLPISCLPKRTMWMMSKGAISTSSLICLWPLNQLNDAQTSAN